jgi:TonB family protein
MIRKLGIAGVALAILLGGSLAVPPKARGQEASSDLNKRKVKTRVIPDYPALARQMKVTGKVKLEATIAADGHVTSTRVVGGSPLLVNAAADALKKYRFEPGPKETTEVIEFVFEGKD